jgi:hypothetical protein
MDMETDTNERAVQAAWEFARREAKGLPVDRLGNDQDMHLVAEGIRGAVGHLRSPMGRKARCLHATGARQAGMMPCRRQISQMPKSKKS